jgi:general stress protein YciG
MDGISRRGFASMDPERRKEVAARGGRNVPSDKRSFAQNPGLASVAGRKGGMAPKAGKGTGRKPGSKPKT